MQNFDFFSSLPIFQNTNSYQSIIEITFFKLYCPGEVLGFCYFLETFDLGNNNGHGNNSCITE